MKPVSSNILIASAILVVTLGGAGSVLAAKPTDTPPTTHKTHPAIAVKPAMPSVVQSSPDSQSQPTIDTEARNAIVIDYQTHAVLMEKNPDQRIPTASMSKIMTAYVVYGYLRDGKAKTDDILPVSEEAWRTGGSKMFVPYPGRVKIDDLLQGMIIQSGNDACIVLAEGLAGSQAAFVDQMNDTAQKLGLTNSHFADVNGLPAPEHFMSVRDLANLSWHYVHDFPQYYKYEAVKEFSYNGVKQGNRNPLLYRDMGADGIKTGHTDEAGYGLVGSAVRGGRRIIMVLAGMESMKDRAQESEKVLDWAFREYENYSVVKAGQSIDEAPVWLGANGVVPVSTDKDVLVTLPRGSRRNMKVTAIYDGPVKAPVAQGQVVGKLVVTVPNMDPAEYPLVALKPVGRLGAMGRVAAGLGHFIWGSKN